MNPLRATFVGLSIGAVVCLAACTKSHTGYPDNPKDVLQAFLQVDGQAAGLSADSWSQIAQYTTWPTAPGWDKFVIINGYDVGDTQVGSTRAQVSVTYHCLGQMSETFSADSTPETIVFHLNKVGNDWKVDAPQIVPHVLWTVMKKRLEDSSAADPKEKAVNDALIAQVTAAAQNAK